jgi:tRNA (guanine-N7-)-methyltransferase
MGAVLVGPVVFFFVFHRYLLGRLSTYSILNDISATLSAQLTRSDYPGQVITQESAMRPVPHIRSFHPRRGRIGTARADALARLWPEHGYDIDPAGVRLGGFDPVALFGRQAPLVLEIGSGMGEATAAMAAADPARDYLGADVHTPGLANLVLLAERDGLRNVRAARGDAVDLLRDLMKPASLDAVHVFFPDPWPKARHHKRRIVRPDVVALMRERLVRGGLLRCATDWAPYAEQMLEVLAADPGLHNMHQGYAPRPPERPVTRFERRALAEGRPVFDLAFTAR